MARVPSVLPIDILHVSDPHFTGGEKHAASWRSFLDHVRGCLDSGLFRPEFIAFTGDLVESPSWDAFRHGVNALLELAECCGFVSNGLRWLKREPLPPEEWTSLLSSRLLVVPGNHDVYLKGLSLLKVKPEKKWKEIADTPKALVTGPLAVQLLDSTGDASWFGFARGRVEAPERLVWPADLDLSSARFRIALVHGHPVQLPYLLRGMDSETLMLMDNAGLLLKNLANLGVRLVLHGHRHYPRVCTLLLPDARGTSRPIVIVGAGSVNKPPQGIGYTYDWIRIHPNLRIEVTMLTRQEAGNVFAPQPTYVADAGDFSFHSVMKCVEVNGRTGDLDILLQMRGLHVHSGRPPLSLLPLALDVALPASLAASSVRPAGGGQQRQVERLRDQPFLKISPELCADDLPLDIEIRYYLHNGVALSDWEAVQMYGGPQRGTESIEYFAAAESGSLVLQASLPRSMADSELDERGSHTAPGGEEPAAIAVRRALAPHHLKLTTDPVLPLHGTRYELSWQLPRQPPPALDIIRQLVRIQRMQAKVVAELHLGNRLLDDDCLGVARRLEGTLPGIDACFFVGTSEVDSVGRQAPFELHLVGSSRRLETPFDRASFRFGSGIAGQALRLGQLISYDVVEAESMRATYEAGGGPGRGLSYYLPLRGEVDAYRAVVAVPVFPIALAKEQRWSVDVCRPPFTLGILCLGSRDREFPLLHWTAAQRDAFIASLQLPAPITDGLEKRLYDLL